jgi:hypothetical protein
MYLLLIRNNIVPNGQKKWENILALGLDETKWREIFKLPFIVTQNTKLQWLQYRIKVPHLLFKMVLTNEGINGVSSL